MDIGISFPVSLVNSMRFWLDFSFHLSISRYHFLSVQRKCLERASYNIWNWMSDAMPLNISEIEFQWLFSIFLSSLNLLFNPIGIRRIGWPLDCHILDNQISMCVFLKFSLPKSKCWYSSDISSFSENSFPFISFLASHPRFQIEFRDLLISTTQFQLLPVWAHTKIKRIDRNDMNLILWNKKTKNAEIIYFLIRSKWKWRFIK